ncbi:hypothetical protein [Natronomonas marina]|uniref:hypothetical protein n=1 Tax=Natronomonas marina TaxID=2961939 RepID=UPI0020C9EE5E|nr:hypothetical protein [Natronomonas marina]
MSRRISQGGLLVILAFLVPVIVELRTIAGLLGVRLSTTGYLLTAAALVVGVLGAVAVWNLRFANAGPDGSEGV